jgi:hypothetical protein
MTPAAVCITLRSTGSAARSSTWMPPRKSSPRRTLTSRFEQPAPFRREDDRQGNASNQQNEDQRVNISTTHDAISLYSCNDNL